MIRPALYRAARVLGDANAAARGPQAIGKRIERRLLGRFFSRLIRKIVP